MFEKTNYKEDVGDEGLITVIDNDASLRDSAGLWLAQFWRVHSHATAEKFLQHYDETRIRPSCLLVEKLLPGMSGVALVEWLAKRGDIIPVVFLTAYPHTNGMTHLGDYPHWELLKPVSSDGLVDAIRRAMLHS